MPNTDLLAYFSPWFCPCCLLLEHSYDGLSLLPHYNDLIPSVLDLIEVLNVLLEFLPLVAEVFDVSGVLCETDAKSFLSAINLDCGKSNSWYPVESLLHLAVAHSKLLFPIFSHLHRPFCKDLLLIILRLLDKCKWIMLFLLFPFFALQFRLADFV